MSAADTAVNAELSSMGVVAIPPVTSIAERAALPAHALVFKRSADIIVGGLLLIVTLPIIAALALAIRLRSPGRGFFTQERVGRDGTTFRIVKLRTMLSSNDDSRHRDYVHNLIVGGASATEGLYKLVGDPRVTKLGGVLRKLSLDELPQLWNVVKGEMSLVGPRPALPEEVAAYDANAHLRLRVKPGLTGLWQVSGRSRLDYTAMVQLDIEYWQDWSVLRELAIIVRTPLTILSGRGAV